MPKDDTPPVLTERQDLRIILNKQVEYIPDWQEMGTCWNSGDDKWFTPERDQMLEVAQSCFSDCAVRLNCLQRGIGEDYRGIIQPGGIWGGYIPDQRVRLRKKLERARS